MQETRVRSLGWEDLLEKEVATHPTILAWRISWTEEPGGIWSVGFKVTNTFKQTEWNGNEVGHIGACCCLCPCDHPDLGSPAVTESKLTLLGT